MLSAAKHLCILESSHDTLFVSRRTAGTTADRRSVPLLLEGREPSADHAPMAELSHPEREYESRTARHAHSICTALACVSHPLDDRDHRLGSAASLRRRATQG